MTKVLYEKIKFDNKFHKDVRNYLENNEGFEERGLGLFPEARGSICNNGTIVYITKEPTSLVFLESRGTPENMIGIISLNPNNPLKEKIKLDLNRIVNN